jgi:hypothetical protein
MRPVDEGWLLSRDFRDQPNLAAARLAQHHIAAHRTWGVSAGLDVTSESGWLEVGPGFAVDRCGRIGILPQTHRTRLADRGLDGGDFTVVLEIIGDGPRARIRLRRLNALRTMDVPLATVSGKGTAWSGDGHRQWMRRPGPTRTLGGVVPRGWPLAEGPPYSTELVWSVHVDLSDHRLAAVPAVVATAAALPPGEPPTVTLRIPAVTTTAAVRATTLEVHGVSRDGFDVTARHHVAATDALRGAAGDVRTAPGIRTAPMPIAWIALLPADRPSVSTAQESP